MTLSEKAKTFTEICATLEEWKRTFRRGAMGNQEAYTKARDMRKNLEFSKWVRLDDAQKEIQKVEEQKQKEDKIAFDRLQKLINKYNDDIGELKQKFGAVCGLAKNRPSTNYELNENDANTLALRIDEFRDWFVKLEEALKKVE